MYTALAAESSAFVPMTPRTPRVPSLLQVPMPSFDVLDDSDDEMEIIPGKMRLCAMFESTPHMSK